jgi:hypothetical protein
MKRRRTNDPDISFVEADSVALWCYDIVEWKVETRRGGKFLMTPIYRDRTTGPVLDATEAFERYSREHRDEW